MSATFGKISTCRWISYYSVRHPISSRSVIKFTSSTQRESSFHHQVRVNRQFVNHIFNHDPDSIRDRTPLSQSKSYFEDVDASPMEINWLTYFSQRERKLDRSSWLITNTFLFLPSYFSINICFILVISLKKHNLIRFFTIRQKGVLHHSFSRTYSARHHHFTSPYIHAKNISKRHCWLHKFWSSSHDVRKNEICFGTVCKISEYYHRVVMSRKRSSSRLCSFFFYTVMSPIYNLIRTRIGKIKFIVSRFSFLHAAKFDEVQRIIIFLYLRIISYKFQKFLCTDRISKI